MLWERDFKIKYLQQPSQGYLTYENVRTKPKPFLLFRSAEVSEPDYLDIFNLQF